MIVEPSEVDVGTRRERDRVLVEAHCNGDPDAFASIVGDHYGALLAQAQRRVRSRGEAEDVVQDTFERAFRAICRFGADDDYRLGAWLSRILANVCNDRGGRLAREAGIPERMVADGADGTEAFETVSDPFVLSVVHDAIDALPASQRDTFLLKERDGLTYPQVADRLEITEENARARVHRARAALQRSLSLTRGMLGGIVAVPVGFRTLLRRTRGYSPAVPSGAETVSGGATTSIAVQLAASPVGQVVATIVPTGAVRGSAIAALAGLAVTGVIGLPIIADSSSSAPPPQAASAAAPAAPAQPAAPEVTEAPVESTTTTLAAALKRQEDLEAEYAAIATRLQSSEWWQMFARPPTTSIDDPQGDAPGIVGDAPAADPVLFDCKAPRGKAVPDVTASTVTPVVSQLELAPVATSGSILDDQLTFTTHARLTGAGEGSTPLLVSTTACASQSDGGAVDIILSNGGTSLRLLGGLVYSNAGFHVFRGTATSSAPTLPWGTRTSFMARLKLTSGTTAKAQLTIVFFEESDAAPTKPGTVYDIVIAPPREPLGEAPDATDPTLPPTTTTSPGSTGPAPDTGTGNPGSPPSSQDPAGSGSNDSG